MELKDAEKVKEDITKEQQQKIRRLYQDAAKDIGREARKYQGVMEGTGALKKQRLYKLEKQLRHNLRKISREIENGIKNDMYNIAATVSEDNSYILKKLGLAGGTLFSGVPDTVVKSIATGQVYKGGWNLSTRIWGMQKKNLEDIHSVIAKGIAENKSTYDIAKDLERYVSPRARKSWNWSKVYPGTNKKIDYNAQRLARTLTQHAYQQSFVETTKKNPFVAEYEWRSACTHRTCDKCLEMHGQRFEKDKLPFDHPNGLCTVLAVTPDSLQDVATQLGNWVNSQDGTYPELDDWYSSISGGRKKEPFKFDKELWDSMIEKVTKGKTVLINPKDYDAFGSEFKVNEELAQSFTEWYKTIDYDMQDAIERYTGHMYSDINGLLRGEKVESKQLVADLSDKCYKALSKAKLPKDYVVRRGSDNASLLGLTGNTGKSSDWLKKNAKSLIGSVAEDKGFMSTTPIEGKGFVSTGVEYRILLPKGTNAQYVAPISQFHNEHEMLVNRGTRFVIEDILVQDEYGSTGYKVYLRALVGD